MILWLCKTWIKNESRIRVPNLTIFLLNLRTHFLLCLRKNDWVLLIDLNFSFLRLNIFGCKIKLIRDGRFLANFIFIFLIFSISFIFGISKISYLKVFYILPFNNITFLQGLIIWRKILKQKFIFVHFESSKKPNTSTILMVHFDGALFSQRFEKQIELIPFLYFRRIRNDWIF